MYSLEILGFGIHVDVVVAAKYTNHKQCVWNIKPLYGNTDHSQQDSVLHHYPETAQQELKKHDKEPHPLIWPPNSPITNPI